MSTHVSKKHVPDVQLDSRRYQPTHETRAARWLWWLWLSYASSRPFEPLLLWNGHVTLRTTGKRVAAKWSTWGASLRCSLNGAKAIAVYFYRSADPYAAQTL